MGEAKRRKLLGGYPDKPREEPRPLEPAPRVLVCAKCGEGGGTIVDGAGGKVHDDCMSAARQRGRLRAKWERR